MRAQRGDAAAREGISVLMGSRELSGIVSYGAYVPYHRLDRSAIRASLGQGGGTGNRTVAAYDEDSSSMGVEAARRALWGAPLPEALYFATTAPAYADKTNATAIHAALGAGREGFATDLGASVRGASGALRAAAATGGMAVLSDIRTGRPGSADEAAGGMAPLHSHLAPANASSPRSSPRSRCPQSSWTAGEYPANRTAGCGRSALAPTPTCR